MTITRRSFIKWLGAVAAAVGLPVKAVAQETKGYEVEVIAPWSPSGPTFLEQMLIGPIQKTDEYGQVWTSDNNGITWTPFVYQPFRTYLPDRDHPVRWHVFDDGVLQSREGDK